MPFFKSILSFLLLLLFSLGLTSCVKDVDLDQTEDISLKPEIQVDLLIFDVDETDFVDPSTLLPISLIRDEVRLEFLDDSYIQDDLKEVVLSFKYLNTFPQTFYTTISFLSETDQVQHMVPFAIAAGDIGNPAVTEVTDTIKFNQIHKIRKSIKMAVEIDAISREDPFTGELKFQSKGLFSFEF